ncbi:anthranilate O-methyltransferase 3-like [Curcuma longa]|uniref:anthranilate O-methyltransferase 3-like n=1 Tax=Curcuma longa TaxID=136217 RepID=UPI003D9ECDB7
MALEQVLPTVGGGGETSYASNSKLQGKSLLAAMPMLGYAIREVCGSLRPAEKLVAVDLGCSSGPNTFLVVSEVLKVVGDGVASREVASPVLEVQFFLNDLSGNDFNQLFRSLDEYNRRKEAEEEEMGRLRVPYYVAGLPGSFYRRLLPCRSVHFFHSSHSVHLLSQMPQGIEQLNERNIYIAESSPPEVVKAYQNQHQKDFCRFLECRHAELTDEGRTMLLIPGRKNHHLPYHGVAHLFRLLAQALSTLVSEGTIRDEKLESYNVPLYYPSLEEIEAVLGSQGLFGMERAEMIEANWDPFDESEGLSSSVDVAQSGKNIAKYMRAALGPMIAHHFGEEVLDEVFSKYAANLSGHLLQEKTKYVFLIILLKKKI